MKYKTKNSKYLPLLSLFIFFLLTEALGQEVYQNLVTEENIQSVRLYPRTDEFSSQMSSPVMQLSGSTPLILEFDDLAFDPDVYSAKLIHCNADWTKSGLRDADFLGAYNEFNVNEYAYAIDTRIPYIHYTFAVPPVRRTGNYVLKVYRGRDEKAVVIMQRFMVYQDQLQVGARIVPPSQTSDRFNAQQIDLNVNYGRRELLDPINTVKVVIRQNQRWDNAIFGLKPNFFREEKKMLEYSLFDGSNVFLAGNEFRFIDLRTVRAIGRNISSIKMEDDVVFAEAGMDQERSGQTYLEYLDMNGQFAVFNLERRSHHLEGEYVLTTFNFKSPKLGQAPYVLGALSNWGQIPASKMAYNEALESYQATLILKQGWYDYQYGFKSSEGFDMSPIEGDHFQTENEYEVFVYYREMGSRYDELIGYTVLNPNKRRP
ncbi:type IX secretion system plug protein [Pararhodonellum marinum]|uniref:type IX secretion system plug protein n=1 Tax=Pararhodonellum marinum TaxID=2755358 RepID=UPI00188DF387|nr:DUF5103 domain-containing protein [Pararhodonellum marinum]